MACFIHYCPFRVPYIKHTLTYMLMTISNNKLIIDKNTSLLLSKDRANVNMHNIHSSIPVHVRYALRLMNKCPCILSANGIPWALYYGDYFFYAKAINLKYFCFKRSERASVCIIPMPTFFFSIQWQNFNNLNPF